MAIRRSRTLLPYVAMIWAVALLALKLPLGANYDFVVYGLIGAAVIYVASEPTITQCVIVLIVALLLPAIHERGYGAVVHMVGVTTPVWALAYAGIATLLVVAGRGIVGRPVRMDVVTGVVGFPLLTVVTEPFHSFIIQLTPTTKDGLLYRLDTALLGDTTFAVGRWALTHPAAFDAARWCYAAVALVAAVIYALAICGKAGRVRPKDLLWMWGIAGAIGAALYPLIPAVGPEWVFVEWPWRHPAAVTNSMTPTQAAARNAMPSLHALWTLLICYGARDLPRWAWLALAPWALLTLWATLGGGAHYAVDLVASVPLAIGIIWWIKRKPEAASVDGLR